MAARLAVVLAAAVTAGCGAVPSTDNDIDFASGGVVIPAARASVDLSRTERAPSEPHTGHAIEAELTGANASDTQAVGATPIALGGQVFSAPQDLRGDSSFRFGEIAYRYRKFFGSRQALGIELLAGVARSQLDLTLTGATQSAKARFRDNGAAGGIGGVWRFRPTTSLQTRYMVFLSPNTAAYRLDLQVVQGIGRNAALRAGVATWYVEVEGDQRGATPPPDIGVRFWGPTLGVDVLF
jgi:hypothetical protein